MDREEHLDQLGELNPDALLADGFEEAYIGCTSGFRASGGNTDPVAVYDRAKCIQILIERDGMSHTEAEEFFSFNTEGAYVGDNGPIYVDVCAHITHEE